MDDLEIVFQRRRLHPRIDRRETPADIDHVDHHRGLADRDAHAFERLDIGEGRHRLAAHVEAHAEPVGMLAGLLQQLRRLGQVAAEFRREAEFGIFARHAQADAQAQVLRRLALVVAAGSDDLLQFLDRIEAEGAHAVLAVGFADRAGRLDGVHEAQRRAGQRGAHQPHFGDRGDVVMRHAVIPQHLQQVGRGIRLHRIERLARKLLDEETGGARGGVRAIEDDRFVRLESANYGPGVRKCVQLKGPPKRLGFRQGCLADRIPLGQRSGAHKRDAR